MPGSPSKLEATLKEKNLLPANSFGSKFFPLRVATNLEGPLGIFLRAVTNAKNQIFHINVT